MTSRNTSKKVRRETLPVPLWGDDYSGFGKSHPRTQGRRNCSGFVFRFSPFLVTRPLHVHAHVVSGRSHKPWRKRRTRSRGCGQCWRRGSRACVPVQPSLGGGATGVGGSLSSDAGAGQASVTSKECRLLLRWLSRPRQLCNARTVCPANHCAPTGRGVRRRRNTHGGAKAEQPRRGGYSPAQANHGTRG